MDLPVAIIERLQADIFVGKAAAPMAQAFRLWRAYATVGDLEATVARYLGAQRARRAFARLMEGQSSQTIAEAEGLAAHAESVTSRANEPAPVAQ